MPASEVATVMEFEEYVVDLNAKCVCGCMDGNRFHKIYHFPNQYGASVASNPKILGFSEVGFRILPIEFQSDTEYTTASIPSLGGGIVDCDTWEEALEVLELIRSL